MFFLLGYAEAVSVARSYSAYFVYVMISINSVPCQKLLAYCAQYNVANAAARGSDFVKLAYGFVLITGLSNHVNVSAAQSGYVRPDFY